MDNFDPNAYLAQKTQAQKPQVLSPQQPPVDQIQLNQFDPQAYLQAKQSAQYDQQQAQSGGLGQNLLAGVEALNRGRTLGLSDVEESQVGKLLPDSIGSHFTSDAIKARQEANPLTALAGNTLGGAALGGLGKAVGLGGLAAEAVTGAAFGGGQAVSDAALGDPNLNAQKILAEVGMGSALGTGLGLFSKAIETLPAFMRGTTEQAEKSALASPASALNPVHDINPTLGVKATSLDELDEQTQNFRKYGGQDNLLGLPIKPEATQAAARLANEMPIPISDYQLDSLSSQDARNAYKTKLEIPGKNGEILRNATGAQKKSLETILDNTINKIAPDYEPTSSAFEAGNRATDAFTDVIQNNRDQIGPAIAQIKATPLEETNHLPGVIDYLTDVKTSPRANPNIANMFDKEATNSIQIKPYSTAMGIDQATYKAIKGAVNALQDNPEDFKTLFNIRKGLDQNIDITKLGDAPREIGNAKAAMMDYIQDAVQKLDPNLNVRQTFADYAKNEENALLIEKKFGAKIGSDNWRSLAKGKPSENILGQIFSDSATTQAAKSILPKEAFDKMLADHLAVTRADVTDKGILSANKFYSKIGKNQNRFAMDQAFLDKPEQYQKMKDLMTVMRTFTDEAPQNPSGTTKTLFQALLNGGLDPFKHVANLAEYGKEKLGEMKVASEINAKMKGISEQNAKLNSVSNVLSRINKEVSSGVKDIFKSDALKGGAVSAALQLSDGAYDKLSKRLQEFAQNPNAMMDHMASNTEGLHQAAPNITQSLNSSIVGGMGFLQSKLPQAPAHFPLSPDWKPSKSQLNQFSKYYTAVDQPLKALKQINNGTLSNETMEALQAVHPQLLNEMRQKVLENMDVKKAGSLNYAKKLALSKFLGQPLDQSMTPQMIQSTQMMYNPPPPPPQPRATKPKTNLGGLKQLKLSNRTSTNTNREED